MANKRLCMDKVEKSNSNKFVDIHSDVLLIDYSK